MINFMYRKTGDEDFTGGSLGRFETERKSEIGGCASQNGGGYGGSMEENGEFGDYYVDLSRFGKVRVLEGLDPISEEFFLERASVAEERTILYGQQNDFTRDFLLSASKVWAEKDEQLAGTGRPSMDDLGLGLAWMAGCNMQVRSVVLTLKLDFCRRELKCFDFGLGERARGEIGAEALSI